jgi:siroheme synthase
VITHGTTGRQRCVTGTLQDIMAKVKSENLQPPSIVVVGDVVRLRKHLKWFDK